MLTIFKIPDLKNRKNDFNLYIYISYKMYWFTKVLPLHVNFKKVFGLYSLTLHISFEWQIKCFLFLRLWYYRLHKLAQKAVLLTKSRISDGRKLKRLKFCFTIVLIHSSNYFILYPSGRQFSKIIEIHRFCTGNVYLGCDDKSKYTQVEKPYLTCTLNILNSQ